MLIDAHAHFWQLGRHGCTWPTPDLTAIHGDRVPDDWQRNVAASGVSGVVAVQSQTDDRDTDWLLDLADAHACVAGVVGWVDLLADNAPARIAHLAARSALKGLRPMLQDLPEDDWILQPALERAIDAMQAHGLCFDALVRPRHLKVLKVFAERHPDLPIMIDHAGKPDIAHGRLEPWRGDMAALAALPNTHCKLSGLVTEAGANWHARDLAPFVDHLLATFGPHRLLWGSDWPVVDMASDYIHWFQLAESLTHLGDEDWAAVFGGNATRFYRLSPKQGNA